MTANPSEEIKFDAFPDFVEKNWLPLTSSQGHQLATYRVRASDPKGVFIFFHGFMCCAIEGNRISYDMAQAGFEVLMYDFVGHGNSGGTQNLLTSYDEVLEDSVLYVNKAKEHYPGLPVFLSGESMGAIVAVGVSVRVPLDGLFLFAPAFSHKFISDNSYFSLLAYFCPTVALPPLSGDKLPSRNIKALIESSSSGLMKFDLVYAGSVKALLLGMDQAFNLASQVTTRLVIIHGGKDVMVEEAKSKRFYEAVPTEDKEYWYYPELHHAALYEPEYPEFQQRLVEWISTRFPKV
mmetsp:Transcript_10315/g.20077  ORF Transcript_10315/g.20077 Transcript_10315/m.20077 type:complete len:293 (-) Transcript_10315:28-906(-)